MYEAPPNAAQLAIPVDSDLHIPVLIPLLIGRDKIFPALLGPLDRTAELPGGGGGAELFLIVHAFRPEPATNIWRYNLKFFLWHL